jgi:transcriptional regulator with XRE-family HTH domain
MGDAGLTQTVAAAALGISQPQLSKRLSGEIVFDVVELEIMARLCEVPAASFLAGAST